MARIDDERLLGMIRLRARAHDVAGHGGAGLPGAAGSFSERRRGPASGCLAEATPTQGDREFDKDWDALTKLTKGAAIKTAALAMAYKLLDAAARWRRLTATS